MRLNYIFIRKINKKVYFIILPGDLLLADRGEPLERWDALERGELLVPGEPLERGLLIL